MYEIAKNTIWGKWFVVFASLVFCIVVGATQAFAVVIDTTNNNFTMIDPSGSLVGGTNDVHFTWDGTLKTSVAATGQVSNATLSSVTPFFAVPWTAHDVVIYGPGSYTVYAGCAAGSPGCQTGTPIAFTVGAGELGAHMLFNWGASTNIDVVDVWVANSVFSPSPLWTGAGGSNPADKVWDWMSKDWDGDGKNGKGMVDGPFVGFNANFNVMGTQCTGVVCDDSNACTTDTCNPATGCVYTNNTASCSDNNACTTNDACSGGTCVGGAAPNCDDGNVCTNDSCNPASGCVHTNNTSPCNDNNACTTGDTCAGGACGGTAVICPAGQSCDPADGTCKNLPCVPADCNDNNACTTDICVAGVCQHTAINCSDNNVCTDDSCSPASGCVYTNNTAACNDNNACTTGDVCSGEVCAGTTISCDDSNVCTTDSCNPATGCVHTAIVCDDSDVCTTDTCNPATGCVHTPVSCNDNNVCTDDSCSSPTTGCVHVNNTGPCSDNNACTEPDTCSGGSCLPGTPVVCATGPACDPATGCNLCGDAATRCNDNNPCTTDTCIANTGACVNTNNTIACSDNNACTTGDICSNGACQPGTTPLNCDDGNACTDDSCVPATGCVHANNTASCDDNNACTTGDTCSAGVCAGTAIPGCANTPPTAPTLVSPPNGLAGLGTTVEFRWTKSTDPDNDPLTYKVYYCTTPNVTGCTPVTASRNSKGVFYAGGAGLLMIGMTFFGGLNGRKRIVLLLIIVALFAGGTLISCSNNGDDTEAWPLPADQMSYTATGLSTNTTYYWKVVADDGKPGGTAESDVQSFKTN